MEGQRDHIGFVHLLQMCVEREERVLPSPPKVLLQCQLVKGGRCQSDRSVNQWVKAGEETPD